MSLQRAIKIEVDGKTKETNLGDVNSYQQVKIKIGSFAARRTENADLNQAILEFDDFDDE